MLDADGEVSAVGGITTHSGATTQLALGTSLDLGDSALIQQDGSTLNVELNSDSVQPLITGGSATLGGDLVVSDASLQARASDAEFQSFKLMDMDSDISGDFTSLTMNLTDKPDYLTVTGTINPEDASEYLLTEGLSWNATATSATPAHGTFTPGAGDSFEVTSVLGDKTGNGDWDGKSLTKLGAGKLTLSGANTYSGDTNVQEGTLWLSGDGTIGEMGSQQAVNVASDATFGGSNGTTVNGKVTNEGTLVFGDSEETGAILTLNGDLINMGTLASGSSSSTPGNTLYVDGDYTGNGGSLYLNTVTGDDDSATDKLVITGDASGTTDLYINGIGNGAQTTNGIEVVDVGGTSTSDAFVLKMKLTPVCIPTVCTGMKVTTTGIWRQKHSLMMTTAAVMSRLQMMTVMSRLRTTATMAVMSRLRTMAAMSHRSTVRISARTWATSGWRATCKCRPSMTARVASIVTPMAAYGRASKRVKRNPRLSAAISIWTATTPSSS